MQRVPASAVASRHIQWKDGHCCSSIYIDSQTSGSGGVQLSQVEGVTIYGPPPSRGRAALASFNVEGLHANDISSLLDTYGAALRLAAMHDASRVYLAVKRATCQISIHSASCKLSCMSRLQLMQHSHVRSISYLECAIASHPMFQKKSCSVFLVPQFIV